MTSSTFTHHGKSYRIHIPCGRTVYYLHFQRSGRRHFLSLATNVRTDAIALARTRIDAIVSSPFPLNGERDRVRCGAAHTITVGSLIDTFLKLPSRPKSAGSYAWALRYVLAFVLKTECASADISILCESTAQKFFSLKLAEANACTDQRRSQQIKRSANSIFRQAAAVFNPRHLAALAEALPALLAYQSEILAFTSALKKHSFRKTGDTAFQPPSDAVIRRVLTSWKHLGDRPLPQPVSA